MPQRKTKIPVPESLDQAVLWTVAWFDVFDQPLTSQEVHRWLWGMRANTAQVELALHRQANIVSEKHSGQIFYFLRGREHLVNLRIQRERRARELWETVHHYRKVFTRIPHLLSLNITNTLALGYPSPSSDIDLFVITEKNHIWTTRFALTWALHWRRIRRHHQHISGRFCLSFFTTEEAFDFSRFEKLPCDPHLAQILLTLTPICNREQTIEKFWGANLWVYEYFPNFTHPASDKVITPTRTSNLIRKLSEKIYCRPIEYLLRTWLSSRSTRKAGRLPDPSGTVISDQMLKFHDRDMRQKFYPEWQKRIKRFDQAGENR